MSVNIEVIFQIKKNEFNETILDKIINKLNKKFSETRFTFKQEYSEHSKRKYITISKNNVGMGAIYISGSYKKEIAKKFSFLMLCPNYANLLTKKENENYFPPEDFVEIAKIVFQESNSVGAWGGIEERLEHYDWEFEDCILWINFFGEELVKKYGKEKLLSAPAYKVEELSNKGILIWSSYLFGTFGFPKEKEIKEKKLTEKDLDFYDEWEQERKIAKHLGIKLKGAKGVELKK